MGLSGLEDAEIEKVAVAIAEGFQSLLEEFEALGERHSALERRLSEARNQVSLESFI